MGNRYNPYLEMTFAEIHAAAKARREKIVEYLRDKGSKTTAEVITAMPSIWGKTVNYSTVAQDLENLRRSNLVERSGSRHCHIWSAVVSSAPQP